jgi:glutamyl-tRNA reductase
VAQNRVQLCSLGSRADGEVRRGQFGLSVEIVLIGLSHKVAPVEIRERLSASGDDAQVLLRSLAQRPSLQEAVYLSTCNRVEIYAHVTNHRSGIHEIKRFLAERAHCKESELPLYEKTGEDAAKHVFRVAASLDSMMVGEPQILGQVKDAFELATQSKTVGSVLNKLFQETFRVAKRVRTETEIAKNAVSLSYAAVELAKMVHGDLTSRSILLIGAGKMGELSMKHFRQNGCSEVVVANRSPERAAELAARLGGRPRSLSDLDLLLERADVVVSSTAAPNYVITARDVEQVLRRRRGRPLVFVDLAVPRDIDPAVNSLGGGIFLFDVDDLDKIIKENLKEREKEALVAERLIDHEVLLFSHWRKSLGVVPTIVSLREKITTLAQTETEKTLQLTLAHLSDKDKKAVEGLMRAVVNKMLHEPTLRLRQSSEQEAAMLAEATRSLFQLSLEPKAPSADPLGAPLPQKK